MEKTFIKSDKLFDSRDFGYNQGIRTRGGDLLFIAGQTALDTNFQLGEATDLATQARRALQNIAYALQAAGVNPANLVSLRMFIADFKPEQSIEMGEVVKEFLGEHEPPAQTLVGVAALGLPELLIEIEAMAVL